ncbi:TRAP transporter small permease [Chromohalobacter beijerinckii]|uniref:TRAP transporter small permease protein n=1 Tax=Chromohalobacter beijerinckii TaxID=86179 RepID=A0ABV8XA34_9GAMM|nr:TRAP transporter small permease [Chromohalobacter beijerinckii]MCK0766791.1 TRAP transporter small permease [Chromohalobacter beijerinckii]
MFSNIAKLKRFIEFTCGAIAGLLLASMSLIALWQVFTRYALNSPSTYTEELLRYLMVWMAFLGAAYGIGKGNHLALTILEGMISPSKALALMIFHNILITLVVLFVIVWGGYQFAASNLIIKSSTLGLPMGYIYSIIPIVGLVSLVLNNINLVLMIKQNSRSE